MFYLEAWTVIMSIAAWPFFIASETQSAFHFHYGYGDVESYLQRNSHRMKLFRLVLSDDPNMRRQNILKLQILTFSEIPSIFSIASLGTVE